MTILYLQILYSLCMNIEICTLFNMEIETIFYKNAMKYLETLREM